MSKDVSLRDLLDCIESCDILINYYQIEFNNALNEEIKENIDGYIGWDYTSLPRKKIEFYTQLKEYLINRIEKNTTFDYYCKLIKK